jgi:DNA integrity scanning protein DisA with diadenylate cyclase activity
VELAASIANMIGGGRAAPLVARAAFMVSSQPHGAILAIVDDPATIEAVVSAKDRYDLRNDIDPSAARPETRLHHLIDADDLDEHTLARLATLDGATILDRDGRLLAYGAVVTTADSEHEGARTAAARTLSEVAAVVLKVSVDGDITVFQSGALVTTLLGRPAQPPDALRHHGGVLGGGIGSTDSSTDNTPPRTRD